MSGSPEDLLHCESLLSTLWRPFEATVNGTRRSIPLAWELRAPRPGPRTVVLGGIHGNEPCGVLALRYLLEHFSSGRFSLQAGSLVLAIGNAEALRAQKRYVGANMNRQFLPDRHPQGTEYERIRVEELKALLRSDVELLLDLHATSAPSDPYAMIERSSMARTEIFGFPIIVSGWAELGDSSLAGDTHSFVESLGGAAITMENGQLDDPLSTASAIETVERVLSRRGVVGLQAPQAKSSKVFHMTFVQRLERADFAYSRPFANLEMLKRGERIGADGAREFYAPRDYDAVMILPGKPDRIQPGENLYHFGRVQEASSLG